MLQVQDRRQTLEYCHKLPKPNPIAMLLQEVTQAQHQKHNALLMLSQVTQSQNKIRKVIHDFCTVKFILRIVSESFVLKNMNDQPC